MRPVNTTIFHICQLDGATATPPWAILYEVILDDFRNPEAAAQKRAFAKAQGACLATRDLGMYCIVYCHDLRHAKDEVDGMEDQLRRCGWIQRSWTLQELVNPDMVHFYDTHWTRIGVKPLPLATLSGITQIDRPVLEPIFTLSGAGQYLFLGLSCQDDSSDRPTCTRMPFCDWNGRFVRFAQYRTLDLAKIPKGLAKESHVERNVDPETSKLIGKYIARARDQQNNLTCGRQDSLSKYEPLGILDCPRRVHCLDSNHPSSLRQDQLSGSLYMNASPGQWIRRPLVSQPAL